MAIPHTIPGQVVDVFPLGASLAEAQTVALFKSQDLEVIRLVLKAGKSLPPHKVPGDITIQCFEGSLSVDAEGVERTLQPGQLLCLRGDVLHSVHALEATSAIVTIALVK
jgi:quercetin dioxygenase-like cupin family protein